MKRMWPTTKSSSTLRTRSAPDDLAKSPKEANIIPVKEKYVLTEGDQSLEIYHIDGDMHNAADLMMVYLPKEKILVEADDFTPDHPQVPHRPESAPPVFSANLMKNSRGSSWM